MINKWVIQETKTKKIVTAVKGSIDEAFAVLKSCGDNGTGYSLMSAPLFWNYKGVRYHAAS